MKKIVLFLVLCFWLAACAPPPTSQPRSPAPKFTAVAPTTLPAGIRVIMRSSSLTLIVDDPSEALSALESAVEAAGGFVASASYYSSPDYGGYASLSARVPPGALPELRRAAIELASEVQSDSLYSQDVTGEYRALHERLTELRHAEANLWQLTVDAEDRQLADSLTLLRDLVRKETLSVQGQLLDYDTRATLASFDVTFNQNVETQIIFE